jgi:glycosyltransferase involved in cell wall biosynthesis
MDVPIVSVIALSYNHAPYIEEALNSVWQQTYPNIEVIIVDDASTDKSVAIIENFIKKNPTNKLIECIFHSKNQGNCVSFNEALAKVQGKYIIDFALDDVMLPNRIEQQVNFFEKQHQNVGIVFSNAILIDEQGKQKGYHYPISTQQEAIKQPSQGRVFKNILEKYFICPPTMMFKRSLLETLKGYDETLSYEDFDIWIRGSQITDFMYLDKITTLYRRTSQSLSSKFYQVKNNALLASTLIVLQKAYGFCREKEEFRLLAKNAQYHQRQCFFTENFDLLQAYSIFLNMPNLKIYKTFLTKIVEFLGRNRVKLAKLYQMYKKLRYANS